MFDMARRPDSVLAQALMDWNAFCVSVAALSGSATGHHEHLVGVQLLTQKQGHVHATLVGFVHPYSMPKVHSVFPNCHWILYIHKILLYNWSISLTGVPILGWSQFTPIFQDSPPPPLHHHQRPLSQMGCSISSWKNKTNMRVTRRVTLYMYTKK